MTDLVIKHWDGEVPDGCLPELEWRAANVGDIYLNLCGIGIEVEESDEIDTDTRLCFRRKPVEMNKYCPYCGNRSEGRLHSCNACHNEAVEAGFIYWGETPIIRPSASTPTTLLPKPWEKKVEPPPKLPDLASRVAELEKWRKEMGASHD